MKFGLIAAAALVLSSQSVSAQPIIVQSGGYGPRLSIGGTIYGRGITFGGAYSTGPLIVAQPQIYAGPVYVPVVPYSYGSSYARPFYSSPYGYHRHHHGRW